ncbi:MAG: nicotinamide riboside transporter PnuC [Candidatus Gastranaerophilales bacterium]|nr:nicotinamide riboside transporter PnuC [Candidatus Gastranaerophilales bacterium]
MKINQFIKTEMSGWTKLETIGLCTVLIIILTNAFIVKDCPIAVISAVCGILYTIIAGKGKISCYLFGLGGSGFYCLLALKNALFGNLILYLGYYIPMQITGIFQWKKHLKKSNNEIYKTRLNRDERLKLILISAALCLIFALILSGLKDTNPVLDGVTTVMSVAGMYLTVKRCIEQWIIWIIVNTLSIIMWADIILKGEHACSTVLMWFVYLILAIYFYIKWKRELVYTK